MAKNIKAYNKGIQAFHDATPWADNPYKAGSQNWIDWNDGKNDAMETASKKAIYEYYRKIEIRSIQKKAAD
jgi:hypothetical protein